MPGISRGGEDCAINNNKSVRATPPATLPPARPPRPSRRPRMRQRPLHLPAASSTASSAASPPSSPPCLCRPCDTQPCVAAQPDEGVGGRPAGRSEEPRRTVENWNFKTYNKMGGGDYRHLELSPPTPNTAKIRPTLFADMRAEFCGRENTAVE